MSRTQSATRRRPRARTAPWLLGVVALVSCNTQPASIGDPAGQVMNTGPGGTAATNCAPQSVDATRYLRQLSLDLRGRPPSAEELARVAAAGEVPGEMVDAMLASNEFTQTVREWHREWLWPTLDGFRVSVSDLVACDTNPATGRCTNTFSPDPELIENAAAHPRAMVYTAYAGIGDRQFRGANSGACDYNLDYPPPAAAGSPQPEYSVTMSDGSSGRFPYYSPDGVPLPYHDGAHCPNYCSRYDEAELAARYANPDRAMRPISTDFAAMTRVAMTAAPAGWRVAALDAPPAGGMISVCPATHPHRVVNSCDNEPNNGPDRDLRVRREGSRVMRHYWSRGAMVRTCAHDAQDRTNSTRNTASCARYNIGGGDTSCGCGPEGVYCMPSLGVASNTPAASRAQSRVRRALNDEPLEIVASVVARDEDYFDIFTTRRSFVNGALVFLYQRQMDSLQGLQLGTPIAPATMPQMAYEDDSMREIVRGPEHAGVLTTSAYLGRFPTWRSRVAQFRSAFMCRPFTPATNVVPAPGDACTREPNLARRCGCQNCHAAIEPMTAYFGRWAERSSRYLAPSDFPAFDPNCQLCALRGQNCTTRCRQEYVTDTVDADGARFAGTLRGYLYRTPMEEQRIEQGPAGLVASAVASGELQSCAVRNAWGKLLGRSMNEDEMRMLLPGLVSDFESAQRSYRALVRAIVTSAAYRRVD